VNAVDIVFDFGRTPDHHAVMLRHHEPWPRHVVIGSDWVDWAKDSAWCEQTVDGGVWLRPTDAAPALYRSVHQDLQGEWHYDLIAVGNPPRFV
jgi:hypothetical protein